ncbi:hypothetical protein BT67DRAFT_443145 [Trichocladium antarcticum]|uniref:Uncharacterized protein n=1 Tax=Trichocladium antarcticum TaxID=1450529 RepID=A0AAN6UIE2_9PEZI|nr:hypothetical protein BT67DRAFT_443145 [Trichocladium antarcticum]
MHMPAVVLDFCPPEPPPLTRSPPFDASPSTASGWSIRPLRPPCRLQLPRPSAYGYCMLFLPGARQPLPFRRGGWLDSTAGEGDRLCRNQPSNN